MRAETPEKRLPLRSGYTTGACATAVSLAAASLLLAHEPMHVAQITLPRGRKATFRLEYCRRRGEGAEAGTVKDAGDDPDVTHQALVFAWVALRPDPGVAFRAGPGVGTVTRRGLVIPVGEPAINPVPRRMITDHLEDLAGRWGYPGGFQVSVGIDNGEELAKRTMNGRLGIVGGLSILGTTGIVRPYSCAAYIASIHQGIDVARSNGLTHVAACTGSTSERAMRDRYGLPDMALVEMGDFVGAVLKYMKKAPVGKLTLAGGFGKVSKLAAGHLDLHSRQSSIDFAMLAAEAKALGADAPLQSEIRRANTSLDALARAQAAGLALGDRVCRLARERAMGVVPPEVAVEVWAVDRRGVPVGYAGPP